MICPTCHGDGRIVILFPHNRNIPPFLPCHRCNGSKTVPDETEIWMVMGEELKDRRIKKRLILRDAARFLDIDVSYLSDMEIGKRLPDLSINYEKEVPPYFWED